MVDNMQSKCMFMQKRAARTAKNIRYLRQKMLGETEMGRALIARKHALAGGVPGSVFPSFCPGPPSWATEDSLNGRAVNMVVVSVPTVTRLFGGV